MASPTQPIPTDPVLAALDRARLRPPMQEGERQQMIALAKEAKGPYQSTEDFMKKLGAIDK